MRNMSFALTTAQIKARTKTVTRRMHWQAATTGTLLCAVEKSQGLRPGEAIKRLTIIRVADRRQEPLRRMIDDEAYGTAEVIAEGFPDMTPAQFVDMFCDTHAKCTPDSKVSRIAFEYPKVKAALQDAQTDNVWRVSIWCKRPPSDYFAPVQSCGDYPTESDARQWAADNWPFLELKTITPFPDELLPF